jgi:hydrogenase expression/formation protein HypE
MADDEFAALWRAIDAEASALGVSILTGHTARYAECSYPWVGAATAMAVGDHDDVVRPDGARPGDALVISTGPAAEVAGLFATLFGDRLGLDDATLATARDRLADVETVRDARAAVEAGRAGAGVTAPDDPGERAGVTAPDDSGEGAGVTAPDDPGEGADVTAMHDATECGIQGALVEMARGAGVRFDVERAAVPVADGVAAVCAALDVEPWHVTSSGTLVIAVAPDAAARVVEALRARDTPAAVVGSVAAGEGVYVDGERVAHPETDPSWAAFAALYDEGTPSK